MVHELRLQAWQNLRSAIAQTCSAVGILITTLCLGNASFRTLQLKADGSDDLLMAAKYFFSLGAFIYLIALLDLLLSSLVFLLRTRALQQRGLRPQNCIQPVPCAESRS